MKVPNGTPVTVATVKPVNITAIALARRSGSTTSAAITDAIDIKIPCDNAEIIRPIKTTENTGAKATVKLPMIKTIIIPNNKFFRGQRLVKIAKMGAPIVIPKAYIETVKPAWLIVIPKSLIINGIKPTLMNSVEPIAKALIANANKVKFARCFLLIFPHS